MTSKCDFHVHTVRSPDSLNNPYKLARIAYKKGLTHIIVLDHTRNQGGLEAYAFSGQRGARIIPAVEYKTSKGDLIVVGPQPRMLRYESFEELVEKARDENLLTILPHPYRGHKEPAKLIRMVDAVEAFNSRTPLEYNLLALKAAQSLGKPVVAGSDAHFPFEIGRAYAIFADDDPLEPLRHGENPLALAWRMTPPIVMSLSDLCAVLRGASSIASLSSLPTRVLGSAMCIVKRRCLKVAHLKLRDKKH